MSIRTDARSCALLALALGWGLLPIWASDAPPAPDKSEPTVAPPKPQVPADSQAPAAPQAPTEAKAPTDAKPAPMPTEAKAPTEAKTAPELAKPQPAPAPTEKKTSNDGAPPTIKSETAATKYTLRYRFAKGQTLRWEVDQRAIIRTTVANSSQTAETDSKSIKMWRVTAVDDKGNATFEHSVESVDMKQKLTGRQEVHYNSQTDTEAPNGFQDVAKAVGVTLSLVTIDPQGKIIKREEKQPHASSATTHMTVALPEHPVAIGDRWSMPYEVGATTRGGEKQIVKMRQQMTLEDVSNGVATIDVDAQVLSPVRDPTVEAQLVQSELGGKIRFDIEAGKVVRQKTDIDKHVVGFQGDASSMHYVMRFEESLLPSSSQPAPKVAGPAPPPAVAQKPAIDKEPAKQPTSRRTTPRSSRAPRSSMRSMQPKL